MKIAVVIPSRGLVHSRMMEAVVNNLSHVGCHFMLFMTHDLPIPDCFNLPTEEVLFLGTFDYVWYVEEDMVFPPDTLKEMIKVDQPVVSVDYAAKDTAKSFVERDDDGNIIFTGLGCMLVKTEVFEEMESPFFRTVVLEIVQGDDGKKAYVERKDIKLGKNVYGTQDIYFCLKLREAGYKINLCEAKVGHLKVVEKGKDATNDGSHEIEAVYPSM